MGNVFGTVPHSMYATGADPGFQVRRGVFKKNSVERREARKLLGYFV